MLCVCFVFLASLTRCAKLLSWLQKGGKIGDLEKEWESFFHDGGIPPGSHIVMPPPFTLIGIKGAKGDSYWSFFDDDTLRPCLSCSLEPDTEF